MISFALIGRRKMLNWILLYCIATAYGEHECYRIVFPTRQECMTRMEQLKVGEFQISNSMCYSEAKR